MTSGAPAKTRIALVGTGGWAGHHARIFAAHPDVEFCSVAGRNGDRVRRRAEQYGARPYTDVSHMLAQEKPDLVSICLPNTHHFEATLQVIEAGVPLFVEKPLVFEIAEADRLLAGAESRNLFFAINFNHRYARPIRLAADAIASGRLGEIVFASWRFGGEGDGSHHPWANLIETQCHGFDLLEHLCGPIHSLSAESTDGGSTVSIALRFRSGAAGSFLGTYDASYSWQGSQRLEICGRAGRILIEDNVRRFEFQAAGSETAEVWQAGFFNDYDREFQRTFDSHFDAMLSAFRKSLPPPVHASAGRRALRLAMAAALSIQEGRRVAV